MALRSVRCSTVVSFGVRLELRQVDFVTDCYLEPKSIVNGRKGAKKFRRRTEGAGQAGCGRTGVFFINASSC